MFLQHTFVTLVLAAALSCAQPACAQPASVSKPPFETLTRKESGYTASIRIEPNGGLLILQVSGSAPISIDRKFEIAKPLLAQAVAGGRETYLLAVGEYPEFDRRLALAAACSRDWNVKRGTGSIPALQALAQADKLYTEVDTAVETLGFKVASISMENVLVCRLSEVAGTGTPQCKSKAGLTAKVPCGSSLLFRLVKQTTIRGN